MAHVALRMTAHGTDIGNGPIEVCCGCHRPFRRGEQMNAMEYQSGDSAGWHCDQCVDLWKSHGEDKLARWQDEEASTG